MTITIVEEGEHVCPKCHVKMDPKIYANPDINPRVSGNPWQCPECKILYGVKDGLAYIDHIKLIEQKYGGNKDE
jgi:hypothetical protein